MSKLFKKKILNAHEIYFLLFPIAILFRSATLNIYIILGAIFFIFAIYNNKKVFLLLPIKILSIFIIYLILISFNAENIDHALKSSVSQIRFLFFMLFIVFLDIRKEKLPLIFFILSVIIYFIILDTFYQYFFTVDLFGIAADPVNNPHRLSGPFGDELIIGSYVTYFSIPVIAFFLNNIKNSNISQKIYYILFIIFSFLCILLSGERISLLIFLSSFLILIIIYLDKIKIVITLTLLIASIIFSYNYNEGVKYRLNEFRDNILNFKYSNHARLFSSAYIVFEKNYLTGTGLKNYRIACDNLKNKNFIDEFTKMKIMCSTHPHNTYFEILAETGIFGFVLFIFFLISSTSFFLKNINEIIKEFKPLFWSSLIIFANYIWPIRSTGSFVSTYTASYFWFFFGVMLLCIFKSKDIKN